MVPSLQQFSAQSQQLPEFALQKCNFNPFHHCLPTDFLWLKPWWLFVIYKQNKIQITFPSCTISYQSKAIALPGTIFWLLCSYIMSYSRPWNALLWWNQSTSRHTNVTSSSFLSLSTWSCYLLIICKPLLCTPSCPVSHIWWWAGKPSKADRSCTSFQPYQWCSGSQSTTSLNDAVGFMWFIQSFKGRCWNISALKFQPEQWVSDF